MCLMALDVAIAEAANRDDLGEVERLRREWQRRWRASEGSGGV
jgi:hypothetical protein